jgi:hypothetical protein
MNVPVCTREAEALDAVLSGGWPASVDADLRAHVESCPVCADVVMVAAAMRDEHTLACQQAQLPSAGLVWWRAELRARQEAARTAARPMTFIQVIAGACGVGAALTLLGLLFARAQSAFGGVAIDVPWPDVPNIDPGAISSLVTQWGVPLALGLGIWLVLVPVALYVALSRD